MSITTPLIAGKDICKLTLFSIFGRTVPNALADKLGRFNVMIVTSVFTAIIALGLWLPATGNAPIIVSAVLLGIGTGAGIGLTPVLVAQLSPIEDIGVRTGTVFFVAAFAGLTGSPIGGQIISDDHGSFRYAIVFGGVSSAIGACLFLMTRFVVAGLGAKKF